MADQLHQVEGFATGIWLVPNANAVAVQEHPEWYLRYKKDENNIKDYDTPALDASNPEAPDYVRKITTTPVVLAHAHAFFMLVSDGLTDAAVGFNPCIP